MNSITKHNHTRMNKNVIIGIAVAVVAVGAFVLLSDGRATTQNHPSVPMQAVPAHTSPVQATTSTASAQGAEDIVPGLYPNPIKNAATAKGFVVSSIMTENNVDAAGNPVSDHLQFTLKNLTNKTLSNFEAYYSVVDAANGKQEGYYKQLTGFSLPPQGSGTVNFDGASGPGHYGVNMHGIYGTATDKLTFKVEVSTPGYAPVYATATKAPGGAEVVGQ